MDIVTVSGLRKTFSLPRSKATVEAVRGIEFTAGEGEVVGLLGPNGAGKTTTLRMLATLIRPTAGEIHIAGCDALREPRCVRQAIGYVGQAGGTDASASGRENLRLYAQVYGIPGRAAAERIEMLVGRLEMGAYIDRPAGSYSGGQRRRLDIATGLIHCPRVLLLDEPSLGLDPQSRANVWEVLRGVQADGTAVLLATNSMEEADSLCSRVLIIDQGRIVAQGAPQELKSQVGEEVIAVGFERGEPDLARAREALQAEDFVRETLVDGETLIVSVKAGSDRLAGVVNLLGVRGLPLKTISLSRPSLGDVFLVKTGRGMGGKDEG